MAANRRGAYDHYEQQQQQQPRRLRPSESTSVAPYSTSDGHRISTQFYQPQERYETAPPQQSQRLPPGSANQLNYASFTSNNLPSQPASIHPSRCPPLDMKFLWKLYHQRQHIEILNQRQNDASNNNNDRSDNNAATEQYNERIQILQSQGFPVGLASLLLQHTQTFPIRIWMVDNSGTMHHNDGHIVTQTADGKVEVVDCSRWQEVSSALRWHAELAAWVQTPMAVRFSRDPGVQVGPQQVGVSASIHHTSNEEVTRLKALLHKIRPTGASTPIHFHLQELVGPIQTLLPELETTKRKLVICVCTDSIPTDVDGRENPDMIEDCLLTLQQFTEWPVQVVIRLLTDEERVVEFYQQLTRHNSNADSRLQVLDDYVSECQHVHQHNPWLHYGYPLHLCREQGIYNPVLEALSKRSLTPAELLEVLRIIFAGQNHPQDKLSFVHFRQQIDVWNKESGKLWNPIKKRFVPWVDVKKLDQCYKNKTTTGTASSSKGKADKCTIM